MRLLLLAGIAICGCAFGQTVNMPSTRLAAGINKVQTKFPVIDPVLVNLTGQPMFATAGMQWSQGNFAWNTSGTPGFTQTGNPSSPFGPIFIFSEQEAMRVVSVIGNVVSVERAVQGTRPAAHKLGMMVLSGPGNFFSFQDPIRGSCQSWNAAVLPVVVMPTGAIWNCTSSTWVKGIQWRQGNFTWNSQGATWNALRNIF